MTQNQSLQDQVLQKLLQGVCIFHYEKKDGTSRAAIGTLKADLIPPCSKERFEKMKQALITLNYEFCPGVSATETPTMSVDDAFKLASWFTTPSTGQRPSESTVQFYYDFEAADWRRYNPEKLISIQTF